MSTFLVLHTPVTCAPNDLAICRDYRRILNPKAKYVLIGGGGPDDGRWIGPLAGPIKTLALSPLVTQDMRMFLASLKREDLTTLGDLMQAGTVMPVIDRRYMFDHDDVSLWGWVRSPRRSGIWKKNTLEEK